MSGGGGGGGGATKVVYIKKKGKHGGGHHGGAWKVAYADFVTAMMALFIVLWLLTQTDTASRERIAQYFRTGTLPGGTMVHGQSAGSNPPVAINIFPIAPPPRSAAAKAEAKSLKELAEATQGIVIEGERKKKSDPEMANLAEHLSAKIVDEGALIELIDGGDNFMFSVSSSELKPGAVKLLQRLAPLLAAVPNKIEIHGHTDARRFDRRAAHDNWDLSFQRANQARQVLEAKGLPRDRISAVLAHADSAPFNEKDRYAPENRRLAILVVREGYEPLRQGKIGTPMVVDPNAPPEQGVELPVQPKPEGGDSGHDVPAPSGASPPPAAPPGEPHESPPHGAAPAHGGATDAHAAAPPSAPAHVPPATAPAAAPETATPAAAAQPATPIAAVAAEAAANKPGPLRAASKREKARAAVRARRKSGAIPASVASSLRATPGKPSTPKRASTTQSPKTAQP